MLLIQQPEDMSIVDDPPPETNEKMYRHHNLTSFLKNYRPGATLKEYASLGVYPGRSGRKDSQITLGGPFHPIAKTHRVVLSNVGSEWHVRAALKYYRTQQPTDPEKIPYLLQIVQNNRRFEGIAIEADVKNGKDMQFYIKPYEKHSRTDASTQRVFTLELRITSPQKTQPLVINLHYRPVPAHHKSIRVNSRFISENVGLMLIDKDLSGTEVVAKDCPIRYKPHPFVRNLRVFKRTQHLTEPMDAPTVSRSLKSSITQYHFPLAHLEPSMTQYEKPKTFGTMQSCSFARLPETKMKGLPSFGSLVKQLEEHQQNTR